MVSRHPTKSVTVCCAGLYRARPEMVEHIEDVLRRVAIEHREPDQMDVGKPTFEAQPHSNIEERLIMVRA